MNTPPLVVELFAGCFGWSAGWLELGGHAIGFDIEHLPHHGAVPNGAELVLQDVHTLRGSQFKNADLILASPPCTEFSYMAMPWSRGRQISKALRKNGEFPEGYAGSRTVAELTALFDACFRIQREACESAGRYIPLIVENVVGAQPWVGQAKAHFGSFYLWGDIGMVGGRLAIPQVRFGQTLAAAQRRMKCKVDCSPRRFDERIATTPEEAHAMHFRMPDGVKISGYSDQRRGGKAVHMTSPAENAEGLKRPGRTISEGFNNWPKDENGNYEIPSGTKQGGDWFNAEQPSISRLSSSRSEARKAASAQIAKIPTALSRWVARSYWPK